jgi:aspartate 1-decarboxylase
VGDSLIIAAYAEMEEKEIDFWTPRIIIVDENNRIKD